MKPAGRKRRLAVGTLLLVVLAGLGCGNRAGSGECRDYEPIDFCPVGTRYVCETTAEGCRWCDCVPERDTTVGPAEPE